MGASPSPSCCPMGPLVTGNCTVYRYSRPASSGHQDQVATVWNKILLSVPSLGVELLWGDLNLIYVTLSEYAEMFTHNQSF